MVVGYLLGCFATGYYLVRWKNGKDIRTLGSGNIGARNVGRVLGRNGFILTCVGDGLKGLVAVWGTLLVTHDVNCAMLALLAVVLGHSFPFQLGFRGGKGVATSIGGMVVFGWHALAFILLVVLGYSLFRRTVPAGLFAFLLLPAASCIMNPSEPFVVGFSILAVIVWFCHRQNLVEELTRYRSIKTGSSVKKL
jgi:glycerol-3-phosphate acyltransferase PlsY